MYSVSAMHDGSVALADRFRAAATWRLVALRARMEGIDPSRLGRVRDAIYVGAGAQAARFEDPRQQPSTYVRGLSAIPWHDPDRFPAAEKLRSVRGAIRDEAVRCDEAGCFREKPADRIATGRWTTCNLVYLGEWIGAVRPHCPVTFGLLSQMRDLCSYGLVYFCALAPQTALATHDGHTNAKLRLQLNLVAEGDCGVRVGGEERIDHEGEVVALDESFANETWNRGPATRLALMVDVWHPDLDSLEIRGFELLSQVSLNTHRRRRFARRLARPR